MQACTSKLGFLYCIRSSWLLIKLSGADCMMVQLSGSCDCLTSQTLSEVLRSKNVWNRYAKDLLRQARRYLRHNVGWNIGNRPASRGKGDAMTRLLRHATFPFQCHVSIVPCNGFSIIAVVWHRGEQAEVRLFPWRSLFRRHACQGCGKGGEFPVRVDFSGALAFLVCRRYDSSPDLASHRLLCCMYIPAKFACLGAKFCTTLLFSSGVNMFAENYNAWEM